MILRLQKSQEQRQNANTAFYVGASSEFDVVAYNENWVAVWSEGGVDESRGSIIDCSGRKDGGAFTSWKPGVYFLPRKIVIS